MAMSSPDDHPQERAGIFYASAAYATWAFMPLYWRLFSQVGPFELTTHRVFWCALFCAIVTLARHRLSHLLDILRRPRVLFALVATSLLITVNWTIFIYTVATNQLVDASLGYYLTPLVSIALGVLVLGEKISGLRIAAIGLATTAVVIQAIHLGHFPWIAPALALTFGFYGYLRKLTPVDSIDGLTVETLLLLPVTAPLIWYWGATEPGAFPHAGALIDILLVIAGPLTAIPLAFFAAGARRVRMTTLGFLQYVSPTITLLLATLFLGEKFTLIDAVTFAFVWSGILLVSLDGRFRRQQVVEPVEL
jgi:chloramphenicol-sensitive protein RarD